MIFDPKISRKVLIIKNSLCFLEQRLMLNQTMKETFGANYPAVHFPRKKVSIISPSHGEFRYCDAVKWNKA